MVRGDGGGGVGGGWWFRQPYWTPKGYHFNEHDRFFTRIIIISLSVH